ncbi:MAG: hypothetical protein U1D97_03295 [Desulfuromonadales bacterium]|nr:hypothetical protein [Desulfuromonadales bacterium]
MRQSSIKIIIFLQVFLYLLGGHATAHGLAWCLSDDGHTHVATAAGCMTGPNERSCAATDFCLSSEGEAGKSSHTGVECRHLPVTAPHAASVASAQKFAPGSVVAIISAIFDPTLRCLTTTVYLQTLFPSSVELPRTVALVSLRTIVLVV